MDCITWGSIDLQGITHL